MPKKRGMMQVDDDKWLGTLKAPQAIIHIKHKISLQQYKYWILLLQEFREQFENAVTPDEKGFYSMPMTKLADLIGYVPNKTEVWNDLLALKNETIAFNMLGKDGGKERYGAGFLSEWRVSNSYIRFKLPSFLEDVMRWLDDPKAMFAQINWEIFNHFTGKYEAIIYKLCKDYIGVPHTPKMSIEHFREYMGIKPMEYPDFKKLNVRVISKPVQCINDSELSDITVKPHFFKDDGGRKITGLHFKIAHKKQTQLPLSPLDESSPFRFAKLPISPDLQEKYLALPRTGAEIALCIERANEYSAQQEKQGKSVNYPALYAAAIAEGWHEEYASVKAKREQKKIAQDTEKKQAREEDLASRHKTQRVSQENALVWSRYEALNEADQQALETAFLAQASELDLGLFHKQGRAAAVFKIYVRQQMQKKHDDTE